MATKTSDAAAEETAPNDNNTGDYVLPMLHIRLPRTVVDGGFWGGLAGSVALGVIDPPLGVLVGAGVLVARHRQSH